MWLLIAFIAVPLIEIALFIQVGGAIGLWPTLLIVVLTAILGTYLVRKQGMSVLSDLRSRMNELRDPTESLAHGAIIVFSGALLLTPGFFTDAVGFSLLVPGIRSWVFNAFRSRVKVHSFGPNHAAYQRDPHQSGGDVIDGEFEEIKSEPRRSQGPSGWTKE